MLIEIESRPLERDHDKNGDEFIRGPYHTRCFGDCLELLLDN